MQTILNVNNIHKYFGKKKVLCNVSLQVNKGDSLGFLGPNGAGKTTLIKIILGLVRPDSGTVAINGYPLSENFKRAVSGVGSVVETPRFYGYLNAYQNLRQACNLHPGLDKRKINEVLDIVGLSGRAKDSVGTYSLGMKQRLGLARALVTNPSMVFLDEPMNGLDPQGMIETRALIRSLQREQGISFFITSHLLSEVEQVCDQIAIINHGEIISRGSLDQLLTRTHEMVDVITEQPSAALTVLQKAGIARDIEVAQNRITVEIDRGTSAVLNQLLWENNIPVSYLLPRKTSLEELFIELTQGRANDDRVN
jgi:ABC-2 type transport system ATP-binding protein